MHPPETFPSQATDKLGDTDLTLLVLSVMSASALGSHSRVSSRRIDGAYTSHIVSYRKTWDLSSVVGCSCEIID